MVWEGPAQHFDNHELNAFRLPIKRLRSIVPPKMTYLGWGSGPLVRREGKFSNEENHEVHMSFKIFVIYVRNYAHRISKKPVSII